MNSLITSMWLILAILGSASAAYSQSDDCASATVISGLGTFAYDTANATISTTTCNQGFSDVFYLWNPPADGDYGLRKGSSSSSLPQFTVYASSDCSFANPILCASTLAGVHDTQLQGLQANHAYLIQIADIFQGNGTFEITTPPCLEASFEDDPLGENDTFASALSVDNALWPNSVTYAGNAVLEGDPDFFVTQLLPYRSVTFETNRVNGDVELYLHFPNGSINSPFESPYSYHPQSPTVSSVTIEFRLNGGDSQWSQCGLYDFSVTSHPWSFHVQKFCNPTAPNSAGRATQLVANLLSQTPMGFRIGASDGPPNQFGYLLGSSSTQNSGTTPTLPGLCLGGSRLRYNLTGTPFNSIGRFDEHGVWNYLETPIPAWYDVQVMLPGNAGTIQTGETFHFQMWHREPGGQSHFSNGVSLAF